MCIYFRFIQCLLVFVNILIACNGKVEIQSLFVPRFVENGTEDSIILDCLYTIDPIEDKNLVVKWFLNDDPEPIYQWIPELKSRHASKRLQGRLNMDFTVNTADPLTQYRALNILRPTIDLSGKYSCHVLSLSSQDSEEETMIVYAIPKSFDFNYTRTKESQLALRTRKGTKWQNRQQSSSPYSSSSLSSETAMEPNNHHQPHNSDFNHQQYHQHREMMAEWQPSSATLNCHVLDVFPLPEMTIYRVSGNDGDSKIQVLTEIEQKVERNSNGAYNVTITSDIRDNELIEKYNSHENKFECLVLLPDGTQKNYQRKKSITYYTENAILNQSAITAQNDYHFISLIFSVILFMALKYS